MTSAQVKKYAKDMSARYSAMNTLKPFLHFYCDMRRNLKTTLKPSSLPFGAPAGLPRENPPLPCHMVGSSPVVQPPHLTGGPDAGSAYVPRVSTVSDRGKPHVAPGKLQQRPRAKRNAADSAVPGGSAKEVKKAKVARDAKFCYKCWKASSAEIASRKWVLCWVKIEGQRVYQSGHSEISDRDGSATSTNLKPGDNVNCPNSDVVIEADELFEMDKIRRRKSEKSKRDQAVTDASAN
jgi:hypothetical protein